MRALTKEDIKDVLKESGVITEKVLERELKGLVTKRDLNKVRIELIGAISNIAVNSPTMGMFNDLEKRVDKIETAVN